MTYLLQRRYRREEANIREGNVVLLVLGPAAEASLGGNTSNNRRDAELPGVSPHHRPHPLSQSPWALRVPRGILV